MQGNKHAGAGGSFISKNANAEEEDDEVDIAAITNMVRRDEVALFEEKVEVDTGPKRVNINPLAEENVKFFDSQVTKTLSIPVQRYRVSQKVLCLCMTKFNPRYL